MEELDFETWFELVKQELKSRGYDQPILREVAMSDYERNKLPEECADFFMRELKN